MKRIIDRLHNFIELVGMVSLVVMILIVSMQVITRLTVRSTPLWAEEVSTLLMVWFSFIGLAIGVREGIHISITYFTDLLPESIKKNILYFNQFLILVTGFLLINFGSKLVVVTKSSTLPATQWPAFMPYLIVPFAGAFVILYSSINLINIYKNKKSDGEELL